MYYLSSINHINIHFKGVTCQAFINNIVYDIFFSYLLFAIAILGILASMHHLDLPSIDLHYVEATQKQQIWTFNASKLY